jgi:hypothetical protein
MAAAASSDSVGGIQFQHTTAIYFAWDGCGKQPHGRESAEAIACTGVAEGQNLARAHRHQSRLGRNPSSLHRVTR